MRQLVMQGPGSVAWEDAAEPELVGGDALVRPTAVALCDADTAAWAGIGVTPMPYPLGHEFVGEVAATAPDVAFPVGTTVVVPFQISCGGCTACGLGHTGNCTAVARLSMYGFGALGGPWGGAFADLVRVPFADHMLVPLPEGVSSAAAANASDNLADAWRTALPYLPDRPGADVLVLGGGGPGIGLWSAELAVLGGARTVRYVDTDTRRLALAEEAGAEVIEGSPARRFDEHEIVVDISGSAEGLTAALRSTTPDGICVSGSILLEDPAVPLLEMYSKNVTLVSGRPHSRMAVETVLDGLASGFVDPLRIATVVGWDEVGDALAGGSPKVVALRQA